MRQANKSTHDSVPPTARRSEKQTNNRMKRTLLCLGAAALVLILLTVVLLWSLFSGLTGKPSGTGDLETYLDEHWPVFRLRAWDAETGALELDYPLRFTYAQMEQYGASLEELRELPDGNLDTVAALKTAAREAAGVTVRSVTVYGMTTDGQIAYTVHPDRTVTACWTEQPAP